MARMLTLKAHSLGLKACVLSPSQEDPAAQVTEFWQKGKPHRASDLVQFFKSLNVLTFESEFIPARQIEKALKKLNPPPHLKKPKQLLFAPSLSALGHIQDRLTQKKLLLKHRFQTADFVKADLKQPMQGQLIEIWERLGPFVLKIRTGGYDGYGTWTIKRKSEIKNAKIPAGCFIAEKFIPFKRELAILSARNKSGQIVFFPLVESFQKDSRCLWVKGPVHHSKLNSLKRQIKKFLHGLNYQGLLAFELFDAKNDLIINELAPRVHNSGHYSLNALNEDQFTTHLKAICNLPLKTPRLSAQGFAMLNLLGEGIRKPSLKIKERTLELNSLFRASPSDSSIFSTAEEFIYSDPANKRRGFSAIKDSLKIKKDIFLWWYGKSVSRKGRKMGHINTTASSSVRALNKLLKTRLLFKL